MTRLGCSGLIDENGLSYVVQVIVVLSNEETKQSLSSIETVGVPVKPDPVNTTVSSPCSSPNLGVIKSR